MDDLEYHKPVEASDPLAQDSLLEKILWWGLIWGTVTVFAVFFIVSLVS